MWQGYYLRKAEGLSSLSCKWVVLGDAIFKTV
jgi:hypothetical protein